MKALSGFVLFACAAGAHVLSMSSSDLAIYGALAHYQLRLPLYEVPHLPDPAQSLFTHIVFSSAGRQARLLNSACREEAAQASYVCTADYEFAAPVNTLDVDCTFYSVTVPNHVHLLRVVNGDKRDQAVFDVSFPHATLRFRPPTAWETAAAQAGGGALRALSGAAQILFLVSLVLAARSRRELILLASMFLAGQITSVIVVPLTTWNAPARFVEAAAGLTVAYLAVEILVLPKAGLRWLIVAVLGAFHGLYFDLFLRTTGYRKFYVLSGAALAELAAIALFSLILSYLLKLLTKIKPVPVCASVLLVTGMAWFFLRLRG